MSRLLDDDELAARFEYLEAVIGARDVVLLMQIHDHIETLAAELEGEKAEGDRLAAAVTAAVTSYRGVVQR